MPNGSIQNPDPPILIGDGSVYMSVGSKRLAWRKWIYHAPGGFTGEAMSWSAPPEIRLLEVRLNAERSYSFPQRATKWSGILVVEYSDGTRLQLRPASADGLGATIVSSRPRRDYQESQEDGVFILKVQNEARVTRAYFCRARARAPIDLFEDRTPYRVMIVYEYVGAAEKQPAAKKAGR